MLHIFLISPTPNPSDTRSETDRKINISTRMAQNDTASNESLFLPTGAEFQKGIDLPWSPPSLGRNSF